MTKEEAVKELIASIVCMSGDLSCNTHCPFHIEGHGCGDRNIDTAEAILFLREKMKI